MTSRHSYEAPRSPETGDLQLLGVEHSVSSELSLATRHGQPARVGRMGSLRGQPPQGGHHG